MANTPILTIPVDDSQFKEFYDLFQEYQERLADMPEDWKNVEEASRKAEKAMDGIAGSSASSKEFLMIAAIQADAIAKGIGKATVANREFAKSSKEGFFWMSKTEKAALGVAKSVFGVGKWLLKLGAIGGGIAGLGGILGAISLRDLAQTAVQNQRDARGVGLTPGQYQAFGVDFGRFLDPSILTSVSNAQNSYQQRPFLALATGLDQNQVESQSPDKLAMRLALRAHEWWEKTPADQRTAENLKATGFSQSGLTLEDMRRLGNTPISELRAAQGQYSADQRSLNVGEKNTQAWYEFERQITLAGKTLETDLTNRLVVLAPSLRDFVNTLSTDARQLIDDILTPKNLAALSEGITDLTTYLGSPQFKQDLKDFAGLIVAVAGAMRKVAKFLGIDTGSTDPSGYSGSLDPNEVQRETRGRVTGFSAASNRTAAEYQALSPTFTDWLAGKVQSLSGNPSQFSAMEKKYGLPDGFLYAQEMTESRGKIGAVSPAGAMGPFQFMPDTAKQYGLSDPFDLYKSADAAGRYASDLKKKYGGDIRKALAAYNWGPDNLDKDIGAHGAQWESHLPRETRDYVNKITAALAKQKVNVNVKVTNSTASRVAVQANAAGM